MIPVWSIACDAGRMLLTHAQDRRALGYLEKAAALDPEGFLPQYLLGEVLYRLQDYRKAIVHFQSACHAAEGNAWAHFYLGMSHLKAGETEPGIEELRRAREIDPGKVSFVQVLGEVLERAGRLQEAGRQFQAAANHHPKDPSGWAALVAFYMRHDPKSAVEACAKLGSLSTEDLTYRKSCADLERGWP
jgi:tetratricopeptide (TPR) repeat protein